MKREKVEEENDNVDCTVPRSVLNSTCFHFVLTIDFESLMSNDSKPNFSQEGKALALTHKKSKRTIFFIFINAVRQKFWTIII